MKVNPEQGDCLCAVWSSHCSEASGPVALSKGAQMSSRDAVFMTAQSGRGSSVDRSGFYIL